MAPSTQSLPLRGLLAAAAAAALCLPRVHALGPGSLRGKPAARAAPRALGGNLPTDPAVYAAAVTAVGAASIAGAQALRQPPGTPPLLDAQPALIGAGLNGADASGVLRRSPLGFSFSVGGLLFPYQMGVGAALTESGHIVPGETPLSGSSAGVRAHARMRPTRARRRQPITSRPQTLARDSRPRARARPRRSRARAEQSLVATVLALGLDLDLVLSRLERILADCREGGTAGRLGVVLQR
jgi:hypothetical protein